MMDTQRLILFVIFSFSILMLWEAWQKEHRPPPTISKPAVEGIATPGAAGAKAGDVPAAGAPSVTANVPGAPGNAADAAATAAGSIPGSTAVAPVRQRIKVRTDLVEAEIDTQGGTIVRLELLQHRDAVDQAKNLVLLSPEHRYAAQTGFADDKLPNHNTIYRATLTDYQLAPGEVSVEVRLEADGADGVRGAKILRFKRASYLIEITHVLENGGTQPINTKAYFHLTRDNKAPAGESAMLYLFTGPAVYNSTKFYQKVTWSDVDKKKFSFPTEKVTDGWVAIVQHYFVSAWLPPDKVEREYYVENLSEGFYRAGFKTPIATVAPGAKSSITTALYAGPQEQATIKPLAEGLDLVVDYGWLKIFAEPLFWVLQWFYKLTGNWGWAIVLLTVSVKALFYPLSAASYKSMAKMKLVTPRMTKLREQYGDDRVKLNQAMMEMYKTEKINPLGGCLPIVVQIPVFIALYWVLLGAVELRQAPWIGWIKDLSIQDPWYILPVLMMLSMIVQTKLNPTPPDPVQAKVMMAMPFIFGIMFFWFPAGLVLYWLVNNILSIAQQWQISKMIGSGQKAAKA